MNDFAVGIVPTNFQFGDYAQPIALVNPSSTRPEAGTALQTSGFGYYQTGPLGRPLPQVSQFLKWTNLAYVSVETCQALFTSQTIDNSVICADTDGASGSVISL